ncbi:hypothetical protein [Streptomyces sp. NPDC008121]|uniref:hypothetical protein n=1 Tax=Streptomyces sp. NPDC008121 TaxID=3364809 RepID=UPI0036E262CB
MRAARTASVSLLSAAMATAALFGAGAGTAQAAPRQTCSVTQETTGTTGDNYVLTNINASYPHSAPQISKWAVFSLSSQPQGCYGGEYFAVSMLTGEVIPLHDGSMSTPEWGDFGFRLPAGVTFAQVHYGDPGNPWEGAFIGSVSRMIP